MDGPRLDRTLSIRLHLGLFLSIALALVILGVITNIRACRSIERQLPVWFDPALRELIVRKSRANARSHRLQHYIVKPFSPKILNRAVSWSDIESMIAGIEVAGTFDTVVGIASGGAFIARRVADRIGVATVHYVHSRLWSRLSLVGNALTSLRYDAGLPNGTNPRFVERNVDLRGKRVLLVDDSVCTGATLACVAGLCRKGGATHVATLALFSNPDHPTDYCYGTSNTPLVWPWGWEAD